MFKYAISAALLATAPASFAQVQRYEKEKVRALLLDYAQNPKQTNVIVKGPYPKGNEREFVEFYFDNIRPRLDEMDKVISRYRGYNLLGDSGSYRDAEEKAAFAKEFAKAAADLSSFQTDKNWTATVQQWAGLSEGLSGQLADEARKMSKERELNAFPEAMQPKLEELTRLSKEYSDALANAPAAKGLQEFTTKLTEARRRFKDGEITFEEADRITREMYARGGPHFVGYQAIQAKGENLNRMAVIRTELAKSKGFNTWAEYQLEVNGQGYEEEYRGPKNQKKFLRDYLASLSKLFTGLMDERIRELGLESQRPKLSFQHSQLLTPPGVQQLQPYFPGDKLTDMWEQSMIESGFSNETLSQILVDDEFRDGKNRTMAYMAGLRPPYLSEEVLNPVTLIFEKVANGAREWQRGLMYILQSYKGTGVPDLRTAFHEGGHALEYLLKYKQWDTDESYGSVEVPSNTMEHFVSDPLVLFHKALPKDGQKPSLAEIRKYVTNEEKAKVFDRIYNVALALYDTEMWDYDYTQPGAQTYTERMPVLINQLWSDAGFFPLIESPVPLYNHFAATTHFTSGNVRYTGYTYAEIGARMMIEYITDEIEKATGRRTWYNQPKLAKIFAEKFFAELWKNKFPTNVEKITGRKFSRESRLELLNRALKDDAGKMTIAPD